MIRGYSDKKTEIRREIMGRAPEITKSYMAEASCKIRNAVFGSPLYRDAESVFLFISMWNEPDTKDILSAALNDGKRIFMRGSARMCLIIQQERSWPQHQNRSITR